MSEARPPSAEEEALWRARFGKFALLRLTGLLLILGGVIVGLSDVACVGGCRAVGAVLGLIGVFIGMILPRRLRRGWRQG